MCFFPHINTDFTGEAFCAGVKEFDCGYCPECLHKRSRSWIVRAFYERETSGSCMMLTLTYDHFKRDKNGNILRDRLGYPLEEPVILRPVIKKDIQDFMKRYRAYLDYHYGKNKKPIKYMATAEYGDRTHRAHYHVLIFGHVFNDRVPYKKSKRGNQIYMSDCLNKLWKNGICTIDAVNAGAKIVRYCTKYCAKERGFDTFTLASQNLGLEGMLKHFNGKNYIIEGKRYSIPRNVWQKVMSARYPGFGEKYDYRYTDRFDIQNKKMRKAYRELRNNDSQYIEYREYWQKRGELLEKNLLSVPDRIRALPDAKYFGYKQNALLTYVFRKNGVAYPSFNSPVQRGELFRQFFEDVKKPFYMRNSYIEKSFKQLFPNDYRTYMRMLKFKIRQSMYNYKETPRSQAFLEYKYSKSVNKKTLRDLICPTSSCHIRADDRKKCEQLKLF